MFRPQFGNQSFVQNNGFNCNPGFSQPNQSSWRFNGPGQGFNPPQGNGDFAGATFSAQNNEISNFTSANDPKSIHSRVFVGNLNTVHLSKEDIRKIFTSYGSVGAISVHKGYAFVQYTNVFEARRAVAGEDQKIYAGMKLDCNIVTEPKNKHASKRPRNNDSRASAPIRQLVALGSDEPSVKVIKTSTKPTKTPKGITSFKDILICGQCKALFPSLEELSAHKSGGCQLKIACKCKEIALKLAQEPSCFTCATCHGEFPSGWDLCVHCQHEHGMLIYKESRETEPADATDTENDEDSTLNLESDDLDDKVEKKSDV